MYGLGSANENMPGYIDIVPGAPKSRPTGFLPAVYGGTPVGRPDKSKPGYHWDNLEAAAAFAGESQRRHLDFVRDLNEAAEEAEAADAGLRNMELAFRMQTEAPELMDLERESVATRELW